ncbi:hypothetical protein CYMTET_11393 [Cymbomonas tetramitiformis]|uniref:RWP-RK domain-containing protein n=1 Tax=Cymbomonas tetramitiformis TaxID=36881 RepID=A0AAE0GM80_9CHLO|nr:hypothetical protein CYMTET_11393 [Cymbomonas tetramitiformis]
MVQGAESRDRDSDNGGNTEVAPRLETDEFGEKPSIESLPVGTSNGLMTPMSRVPYLSFDPQALALRKLFHALKDALQSKKFLLQFWCSTRKDTAIEELVCDGTPFLVGSDENVLMLNFRTHSSKFRFQAQDSTMIGRVYTTKFPEVCPDIECYGESEYKRLHGARECSIKASFGLPLVAPGSDRCLGVVEIVQQDVPDGAASLQELNLLTEAFSVAGLCPGFSRLSLDQAETSHSLVEAAKAFGAPRASLLGQRGASGWLAGSRHSSSAAFDGVPASRGNQGVVGQVLAAGPGRVAYCPDVRMLSVTDYPFAPAARLCHLSGVCAFGLRLPFVDGGHPSSEHEPNLVLECFLPPTPPSASLMEVIEAQVAQVRVLISVLQTAAKELNISAVVPNEGDVDRIIMIRGENTVRRGRSGNLDLTKLTASPVAHMARRLPGMDPMAPSTPPMDALMAPPMEAPMPRAAGAQGPLVTRKPGTGGERIVSLEVLQQHFVHDLRTAAKKIGVCSTTLKRICRQYNIARWPCRAIRRQRQWDQNMEEAWAGAYEGAQQPSLQIPPHSVVPHPSSAAASGGSAKPDPPHQHPQRCAATAAASAIVSSAPEPPATEASAQHGTLAPPSSISAPFPGVGHLPSSSSAEPPTLVCFDRDQASSHAPASVSCWTGSQAPPALVSAISRHEGEASSRVAPGKAVAAPHSLLKPDLPGHPPSSHLSQLASHPTNQRPVAPAMSTSASVAPVASLESAPPPTSSWYEPLGLPPPTDLAEGSPHGLGDELARSTWQLTSKIIDSGRGYMLKPGYVLSAGPLQRGGEGRGGLVWPESDGSALAAPGLLGVIARDEWSTSSASPALDGVSSAACPLMLSGHQRPRMVSALQPVGCLMFL